MDSKAIIKISADWCGPCRMLAPVIDAISAEHGTKVISFDIDTEEGKIVAAKYDVASLPTIVLINDEKVLTLVGVKPKHEIEESMKSIGLL